LKNSHPGAKDGQVGTYIPVQVCYGHPVIILAQIPPPMINHTAERMKNTVALSLFFLRFARPINKKITGGANVKAKHKKINVPIPSMVMTDL
jgi:hypothetical protein